MYYLIPLFIIFSAFHAYGHGGEVHPQPTKTNEASSAANEKDPTKDKEISVILSEINLNYLSKVKKIFSDKCLSCHGVNESLPWYYKLPGAKQLMDQDMKEAKTHMDMSNDFPFGGHGSPIDDLSAISKTIDSGDMPPLEYRLLHWGSKLTKNEIKVIALWIKDSQALLNKQTTLF